MNPQLSVIIPSYNHAKFIGEGIRSILAQSFQDFEIIITDDYSKDNSAEVIRQFSDPRIKLKVFEKNKGFAVALNDAIRRSCGDLISVLGSDDFFLPGTFAKQLNFLRDHEDIAAVFGMPKIVDERGAPIEGGYREFTNPFSERVPSRKDWLRHFFSYGNCLCHPTLMIRRSVHNELGLYDSRLSNVADLDMWVRICMKHEIHVMRDELVARRILDNNRNLSAPTEGTEIRSAFELFQILKHYRNMPLALALEVFADALKNDWIDTRQPFKVWLGQIAMLQQSVSHQFFGLDTMFEGFSMEADNSKMLVEMTGMADVFQLRAVKALAELQQQPTGVSGRSPKETRDPNNPALWGNVSRNEPCPCGSGMRYKHCHGRFA